MTGTFEERQAAFVEARRQADAAEALYVELVVTQPVEAGAVLAELLRAGPASHGRVVVGDALGLVGVDAGVFEGVLLRDVPEGERRALADDVFRPSGNLRTADDVDGELLARLALVNGPVAACELVSEGESTQVVTSALRRLEDAGLVGRQLRRRGQAALWFAIDTEMKEAA